MRLPFLPPDVSLGAPWVLWLALLVPLALWWGGRRPAAVPLAAPDDGGREIPATLRSSLRGLPRSLVALGLLLVVTALAAPVRRVPEPVRAEGIDIVLCLDVSSSMSATDMKGASAGVLGTRLDVAREAALRFVEGRPADRIGLVQFARYADVACPPTRDHEALAEMLRAVAPVESDGPEDATGIGNAAARAASLLESSGPASRIVVLLTDGEENVATAGAKEEIAPREAAQLCRALGVRVYGIAAGDVAGIDTSHLLRLARESGGRWFAAPRAEDVDAVYDAIDELERAPRREPRYRDVPAFELLALIALGLLGAGLVLRETVFRELP